MATNQVERALNAGIKEVGPAAAALLEDQWFERKSARVAPRDLAVALVAFANAEGGTVVVGIHDGQVEGMQGQRARLNDLRQASIDYTSPPVRMAVEQIGCVTSLGATDALLIFRVPPAEGVHELTNGECYLRVGDESRKLGFAQRQELYFDRGISQFDGQAVAGASIEDLDQKALAAYRASAGATGTFSRLLRARGLLTPGDDVTTAGYLLFAPLPTDRLPQAVIRVLSHRTTTRGTGSRLDVDSGRDVRVEGPIPQLIEQARALIEEWQPQRTALGDGGRFFTRPVVPRDAWIEGLVNAVVHRSYSLAGDHIRVEIFPNRIEIESPGRFPGLADPSNPMEISRYARNPRIARVCTDLAITQELGEGIKRMFDEMRERGLLDPIYVQSQGSVRLTLSGLSRIPPEVEARLPRGSIATLNALRATEKALGTGDLVQLVQLSRPTVVRQLNALRDENLVRWTGKSAKDPRAQWEVAE